MGGDGEGWEKGTFFIYDPRVSTDYTPPALTVASGMGNMLVIALVCGALALVCGATTFVIARRRGKAKNAKVVSESNSLQAADTSAADKGEVPVEAWGL